MNSDFHYYATYYAARIAGFNYEEALTIAYSATFVDFCSKPVLEKAKAPKKAATVQSQSELLDISTDIAGIQEMTRVWASFHFLPGILNAKVKNASKPYLHKYQLICHPNGELLLKTINLVKGTTLEGYGLAMHVLADTWAHQNFAGTPSLVINNSNNYFYEFKEVNGVIKKVKVHFHHNPSIKDNLETSSYVNSMQANDELSIMNLGHGRIGHIPDYSFIKYRYLPAWDDYHVIDKDNTKDFMLAFQQMVYALKCLKNGTEFELNRYDEDNIAKYKDKLYELFIIRQIDATESWKKLCKETFLKDVPDFNVNKIIDEYISSKNKKETGLGKFVIAASKQKTMVSHEIYLTGSILAGYSSSYVAGKKNYQKNFASIIEYIKQVFIK